MLKIDIAPSYSYPGISIRPVDIPRDSNDLTTILKKVAFHPLWNLQTQSIANDFYQVLLQIPSYNAYIISYLDTTLFMLEILPISHTEFSRLYDEEPNDYSLQISLGIDDSLADIAVTALRAALDGIFANTDLQIHRVIFPLYYSEPGSLLNKILGKAGFFVLQEKTDPKSPIFYAYPK